MIIDFTRRTLTTRLAALALIGVCLFQLPAQAATTRSVNHGGEIELLSWSFGVVAIADGQSVRATLANSAPTALDENGPVVIGASLILYDERGSVVAQGEQAEILPGKFGIFDVKRSAIARQGDRMTKRVQVFTELKVYSRGLDENEAQAIRGRAAEFLPASFEVINDTGETSVAFPRLIGMDGTSNTVVFGEGLASVGGGVKDSILGIVPVQLLLYTVRNLSKPDESGEPISFQVRIYDKNGEVSAVSPEVEIPPGEFRTVRFNYGDLPIAEEAGTRRKQVRTVPLCGLRSRDRLVPVAVSLEIVNAADGRTAGAVAGVLYAAFHNNDL
jgi:hypothetical protein